MEKPSPIKLFASPWPWLFLIPIMIFLVSLFAHHSYAFQIVDIERNFATNLKLKMEALEKIIGSRSGENSAMAADQKLKYGQPVFVDEIIELKETADQLVRGPTTEWQKLNNKNYGPGLSHDIAQRLGALRADESLCMWWMTAAVVIASLLCACAANAALRAKLRQGKVRNTKEDNGS